MNLFELKSDNDLLIFNQCLNLCTDIKESLLKAINHAYEKQITEDDIKDFQLDFNHDNKNLILSFEIEKKIDLRDRIHIPYKLIYEKPIERLLKIYFMNRQVISKAYSEWCIVHEDIEYCKDYLKSYNVVQKRLGVLEPQLELKWKEWQLIDNTLGKFNELKSLYGPRKIEGRFVDDSFN